MISTPPTWPRRNPSSSRASCSSSTSTARKSILRRHPFGNRQLGNIHDRDGAAAGDARQLQGVVRAVDRTEPLVDIAQADAAVERVLEPLLAHAEAVVVDFDRRVAVANLRPDRNPAAADLARQPVLDRILDQRL